MQGQDLAGRSTLQTGCSQCAVLLPLLLGLSMLGSPSGFPPLRLRLQYHRLPG